MQPQGLMNIAMPDEDHTIYPPGDTIDGNNTLDGVEVAGLLTVVIPDEQEPILLPDSVVDHAPISTDPSSVDDVATSVLIAEAAAAAVQSAAVDADITAAVLAAQDAAQTLDAATAAAAAAAATVAVKEKENRRKRYREKATEEGNQGFKKEKSGHESVSEYDSALGGASVKSEDTLYSSDSAFKDGTGTHAEQLASRRLKDRQRYANMTLAQRELYNSKRREQYHKQNECSRQKRRERERNRYHSLDYDSAKERNARRAKLERERYQKLSPDELEAKNRKRRERAAALRHKKDLEKSEQPPSNELASLVTNLAAVDDMKNMEDDSALTISIKGESRVGL